MTATISVTANANDSTITISDGNSVIDAYISKITVYTDGDDVVIQWDADLKNSYRAPYQKFATPSGASAIAVEEAIAALLVVGGGGGGSPIKGSIVAPEVAFGDGAANNIAGDPTFTFDKAAKVLAANRMKLNAVALGTVTDGLFEYDGTNLYFTQAGVRYLVQLTQV